MAGKGDDTTGPSGKGGNVLSTFLLLIAVLALFISSPDLQSPFTKRETTSSASSTATTTSDDGTEQDMTTKRTIWGNKKSNAGATGAVEAYVPPPILSLTSVKVAVESVTEEIVQEINKVKRGLRTKLGSVWRFIRRVVPHNKKEEDGDNVEKASKVKRGIRFWKRLDETAQEV